MAFDVFWQNEKAPDAARLRKPITAQNEKEAIEWVHQQKWEVGTTIWLYGQDANGEPCEIAVWSMMPSGNLLKDRRLVVRK